MAPTITFKEAGNCSSDFLKQGQYQLNGIRRYERIFGKTWVSTGGETTTKEFLAPMNLKPGMKVLDIGSGAGGSALYMAREYGVEVLGIDMCDNMLECARQHRLEASESVQAAVSFRYMDALTAEFPENTFDLIYSRDAIFHIADKDTLYANILKWLKPGGQLLVTEYIHGPNNPNHPAEYVRYINLRGYQMVTLKQYEAILNRTGFSNVQAIDQTQPFKKVLIAELEKFKPQKTTFIKEFTQKDYDELVEGWEQKVVRIDAGDMGWALFKATKAQP